MRLIIALLGILLMADTLSATPTQGWDYQYVVKNVGKRNEYVVGDLLFERQRLSSVWNHVITPVGEFMFMEKSGWLDTSADWVPVTVDKYGVFGHVSSADVKSLLAGDNPAFRKCTDGAQAEGASNIAYIPGKFEERPKEAGSDWFYVVKLGWWVNPKKMDEVAKKLPPK